MTDQELFEEARSILHHNMVNKQGKGTIGFHYTKPSPGRYPFQFFWDTCFHIFILNALGEQEMARKHLISLFALQEEDGFVGHMIFWDHLRPERITDLLQSRPGIKNLFQSHMSALIQPPLVAQALASIFQASGDKLFLQRMLPKIKHYFRWLAKNRDFEGEGLLTIISPFESGMDWKPSYDIALGMPAKQAGWRLFLKAVSVDFRNYIHNYNLKTICRKGYFQVKDVGMNAIYAQNLQVLADLCKEIGDPEGRDFEELGEKATKRIVQLMYDEQDAAFYDVFGKENRKIRISTPTIFYPLILKTLPDSITEKVIKTHLLTSEEFITPYPVPSVAKSHSSFNANESMYIWRGPTWIVNNWFIHRLLIDKGYWKESDRLIESIRKLIEKSGFREYYNPFNGEGYGAKDFTWAGLVVDMIRRQKEGKPSRTEIRSA